MHDHDENKGPQVSCWNISKLRERIAKYTDEEKGFAFPPVRQGADKRENKYSGGGMDTKEQSCPKFTHAKLLHVEWKKRNHHAVANHGDKNGKRENEQRARVHVDG